MWFRLKVTGNAIKVVSFKGNRKGYKGGFV